MGCQRTQECRDTVLLCWLTTGYAKSADVHAIQRALQLLIMMTIAIACTF